jgi:hypothetical protein
MQVTAQNFHLGQDGFIWWIGVIVGRQDPLLVGRCKVRIFGYHNFDLEAQSNEELPWAFPLMPVTASRTLPDYKEGDWVMGFFLDGILAQQPIIFGVLPALAQ